MTKKIMLEDLSGTGKENQLWGAYDAEKVKEGDNRIVGENAIHGTTAVEAAYGFMYKFMPEKRFTPHCTVSGYEQPAHSIVENTDCCGIFNVIKEGKIVCSECEKDIRDAITDYQQVEVLNMALEKACVRILELKGKPLDKSWIDGTSSKYYVEAMKEICPHKITPSMEQMK